MAIKFVRIDDRLIHGQVVTAWIKHCHAGRVIIVDDFVNGDEFLKNVLRMVAPSGVELVITGTERLQEDLAAYEADKKNGIILVKTPATAKKIFDAGLPLRELNLGGMGANETRRNFYKNISASEEEIAQLRGMEGEGIKVYIQVVPADRQIPLNTIK